MSRAPFLRRPPRRDQRSCRLGVEPLEDRRMLNVAPTAVDDAYELNEDTPLVTTNVLAPSDGLVHHWTFDETSGDVLSDSAGELNGSLVNWGASEETWVEGVVGGALDMGDADNHVLLDGSIGSGDTYTISVWSRLDQTGALNPRILGWLLQNTEIAGGVGIYFKYQSGQAYSPSDPVVGQWEHYALTTDRISGAATIYRDGVAVGTGTFRPDRPDGRPWLIGHHINPGYHGGSWDGLLDDLRVYDRVLSAQEVQKMYSAVTIGNRPGVLLNDSDADGDALTAAVVDEPLHGDLTFNLDGTFTYTPDAEFSGTDTFTYRANDGTEESNLTVAAIIVHPVNDAPLADDDPGYVVDEDGQLVVIAADGVLANDSDVEFDTLTASLVSSVSHGTLVLGANGSFTYMPEADFFGQDMFTYRANDGELDSSAATVIIVVNPINDAPVAVDDQLLVNVNKTLIVPAPYEQLILDDGPIGYWRLGETTLSVALDTSGNGLHGSYEGGVLLGNLGAISLNSDTSANFDGSTSRVAVPSPTSLNDLRNNFTIEAWIKPEVLDGWQRIFSSPPEPKGFALGTVGNSLVFTTYGVKDYFSAARIVPGIWQHVAVVFDADNDASYFVNGSFVQKVSGNTPARAATGRFFIGSSGGSSYFDGSLDEVAVYGRALAPEEIEEHYLVGTSPASIGWRGVLANDVDFDGDQLVANLVADVQHGSLLFNTDGSFEYTPDRDFVGIDTFTYLVSDGQAESNIALVTIKVNGPLAGDDEYEIDEDEALAVGAAGGLLSNDGNDGSGDLTAVLVDDVRNGTLTLSPDGSFTYEPTANFFGTDKFTYSAVDGELDTDLATVTITVHAVQDAPVAVDDKYVAEEDTAFPPPVEIPPGLTLVEWPENGHFYGIIEESKTWAQAKAAVEALEVSGNPGHLLTITSDAENDFVNAAVLSSTSARRIFIGLTDSETEGTFVWVTGEPVTFSNWNVGEPSNSGDEDVVELHWLGGAWRWNDVPSWFKNPAYVVEFESSPDPSVLDNDRDADGDPLIVTLVENVKHGALDLRPDGTFTYVPDPEFSGKDTFTYRASDGTLESELATVTITVQPVNDAPVADDDGGYELDEDGELIVDADVGVLVGDSDVEGDPLTARLVGDVGHGTLALAPDGSFNYTPNADFFGDDSFTYVANDGELDSELATVTITVNPIDDPPVAVDDEYQVNEDVVLVAEAGLAVTANDEEPDGDALAVTLIDDAMHGTLELAANGTFVYTPGQDFNGTDSFTYFVDDGTTTSNVATVTITVVPVNDPPLAEDDAFRVPTSGSLDVAAERGLLENDSDVEGDPLAVILVEGPAHGTLLLSDDGSFEYTPEGTFDRFDSFTYRAGDGQDLSEITTVTLTLDAPLVEAGDHVLRANTPGQTISILVSGEHDISGLNLFVQIGDGGPELVEFGLPAGTRGPRITAVDLKVAGTIFAGVSDPQIDEPGNLPQVINSTIALAGDPTTVEADGTLAILTIDTTGLFGGEWDLLLSDVLPGLVGGPFETDFAGEPAIIESGRLRIVPAEVVDRHLFYNDSVFDGRDAAAGEADDAAIAPDKTALFSGDKAAFANYSSFVGGITGVMLDVARLLVPEGLSADDFIFRAGRSNDPATWQPVEAPASVSVRSGAGLNGSHRISLTWPAGTIEGTWLEVTLKSNANTGLPADDVFYFGSAVGESGNEPKDALVNATDVIAVRNNPRGPLNQATLENLLDFNRDALVNATDLVLARDHTTGLFSALPLITPVATGGAPSPGAAAAPQAAGAPAGEMPTIVVGEYTLAANTPNQQIEIFVSGGQSVAGVNLVAQVGDGGPELVNSGLPAGTDGPAITSVDLKTGTIFAALDVSQFGLLSLPQVHFSSLGIEAQNTTVSADGLLATLSIDTTGIFGGSFQLLLAGVLPQLTNGPFATDFAGIPIEITNGVIIVESSQPADLTGNGFVDFEDLTVLLAAWNQNVSAAEGNLIDADNTPVNFDDLTVLLAAWTGPGPAGAPVGRRLAAAQETSPNVGSGLESDVELGAPRQAAAYFGRREARRDRADSALRRLQSAAVDRAMADDGLSDGLPRRGNHFSRRSRRSGR